MGLAMPLTAPGSSVPVIPLVFLLSKQTVLALVSSVPMGSRGPPWLSMLSL